MSMIKIDVTQSLSTGEGTVEVFTPLGHEKYTFLKMVTHSSRDFQTVEKPKSPLWKEQIPSDQVYHFVSFEIVE